MALNMDAIGKQIGPLTKTYNWKDVVLYALGVGAGFDELDYVYEKDLKVIPSFSIASTVNFPGEVIAASGINLAGILHGEQDLIFHSPIPPEGTLTTNGKITHYYDKGKKGALIVGESETFHDNGKKLFTSIITLFGRLDGGFGGEDAPAVNVEYPDREPDFTVEAVPSADQPLIYRLSGDVFQLHVDPEFAKMVGYEKPIMHGLCTHGYACRALVASLVQGKTELVRRFACRFTKTLYPGEPIKTVIWKTGEGKAVWRTVNANNGDIVIDNGIFEYGEIPKDEVRFDGRVAIVTGAGGGLGRTYALELAKRGAKLVINDFGGARDGSGAGSATPAQKVVDEIKALGGDAVANYDNVATIEGGEGIVKSAVDTFGRLDILINNAGILRDKAFLKMEPENWKAVLDVHLNGAYNVTRPAFQVMRDNGYGRIIMTTSAAGLYGNFGQTNYSSAKMALVGLMNTLKLEGAKYDIKVNTIAPLAASRLTEDVTPPEFFEKMKPEFVSAIVLYLASEKCPVNGKIYNAGMGYYSRAAVVTGPGAVIGDGKTPPGPEEIAASWGAIKDLADGKEYDQLNSMMGDLIQAFDKPQKKAAAPAAAAAPASDGIASVAEVFEKMSKVFDAKAAGKAEVTFQFSISGSGGGEWNAVIKDGACAVSTGVHDKPTCTIKMEAGDFLALMNGKLPGMQAYTSGKLKIGGDLMKSQLLEKVFKF
jgi:NAD(P)-dependent dehydrogenase (short-subunit alcohol dehydrogenase family)/acyl dehydratase/putative sterol carrier protein